MLVKVAQIVVTFYKYLRYITVVNINPIDNLHTQSDWQSWYIGWGVSLYIWLKGNYKPMTGEVD